MVEVPATVAINNVELAAAVDASTPEITTDDYSALANKPSINGVVLIGDKSSHDLHLADLDDIYNFYPTDTAQGAVATFPDGAEDVPVKSLSVSIDPVQDLHGYESPWVAGAGVNQIGFTDGTYTGMSNRTLTVANSLITVTATGAVSSAIVVDATRLASSSTDRQYAAGTYVFSLYNWAGTVTGATRNNMRITIEYGDETTEDVAVDTPFTTASAWKVRAIKASSTLQWTANAYIAFRFVLAKGSTVPSDWAPYTNICPISGHTQAVVTRTGKNLLNPKLYTGLSYNPAVGTKPTLVESADQFTNNGNGVYTITTSSTWKYYTMIVPVAYGVHYWRKYTVASTGQLGTTTGYMTADFEVLSVTNNTSASQSANTNMTDSRGENVAYFFILISNRGTASATITLTEPQVEIGTSATAYEPYRGEDYTIDLDGTRYGGTLDATNGVLTLTHGYADLGSLTWTEVTSTRITVGSYHRATIDGQASSSDRICSNYKLLLPAGLTDLVATWGADIDKVMFMAGGSNAKYVYIIDSSYTTAADFKTAMNGVDYVYLLATPVTVQLTPTEVATLLGDNNIFCSTGDVDVTYRADMGLFIRKVIGGG